MPRKSKDHLAYYASPNDASPQELAVARFACRLILSVGPRAGNSIYQEFREAAGRLLLWNRPLLLRLSKPRITRSEARTPTSPGSRRSTECSLEELGIGDNDMDEPVTAAALVDPDQWENLDRWFARTLNRPSATRRLLLVDSLAWIDSAREAKPWTPRENIGFLAESLQLSDAERAVVELVAVARGSEPLRNVLRLFKVPTLQTAAELLAAAFETSIGEMRNALHASGTLARLGLIGAGDSLNDLEDLCTCATNLRLYDALQRSHENAHSFLGSFLKPAPAPRVTRENIQHLAPFFDVATRLLGNGLVRREPGINVLLHGAAGTGKTEFARLLAKELGVKLYEVDGEDEAGSSANSKERLAALVLASRALQGRDDAVLLFDEAEDAFPYPYHRWFESRSGSKSRYAKAWMNRLLETMPVPVVWVSNCIDAMDPAYLRRFTLHVRFRELPGSVKRRIADQYLGETAVGEEIRMEIARLPALTPGQLETASRVLDLCQPQGSEQAEQVVRLQLRAHREAVGLDYQRGSLDPAIPYQPGYVNLREPMSVPVLLSGLRSHPRAALCFFGLPGTGKTQLAHHLAAQLGRELVYKSASDLLSMWVGETEKLIAELFAEAEDRLDEVVILLDEADTFLRDRKLAQASWELSHTNEFLARMERFPGLFICATNLVDTLDAAILRRFQFRVEFLAMRREQSIDAFGAVFGRAPTAKESDELKQLPGLVPADFANVARQLRFYGEIQGTSPVAMLGDEIRGRRGGEMGRSMGFSARIEN